MLRLALAASGALVGCASPQPTPASRGALGEPTSPPLGTTDPAAAATRGKALAVRITDPSLADEFNNIFASDDVYIAGWPTEQGLKALAARGVTRIIALKTPDETMHARGYDPRAVARQLGMELIVLPVRPDTYSASDVAAFAAALEKTRGPVLVHCGSASTCAMVWSGYLAKQGGQTPEEVLAAARAAGLLDGPMTDAAERVAREILAVPAAKPAPDAGK